MKKEKLRGTEDLERAMIGLFGPGNQIKSICVQLGLGNRVDGLIAELKAAGIISPRLSSIPEVIREGSPIYELNPSVAIGLSP